MFSTAVTPDVIHHRTLFPAPRPYTRPIFLPQAQPHQPTDRGGKTLLGSVHRTPNTTAYSTRNCGRLLRQGTETSPQSCRLDLPVPARPTAKKHLPVHQPGFATSPR